LTRKISNASIRFDGGFVDGAVNGVGTLNRRISYVLKRLQTGYVYNYAMALVFGIAVILALVVAIF
jgi:NADH-quinone oxidoreductase subunit L